MAAVRRAGLQQSPEVPPGSPANPDVDPNTGRAGGGGRIYSIWLLRFRGVGFITGRGSLKTLSPNCHLTRGMNPGTKCQLKPKIVCAHEQAREREKTMKRNPQKTWHKQAAHQAVIDPQMEIPSATRKEHTWKTDTITIMVKRKLKKKSTVMSCTVSSRRRAAWLESSPEQNFQA